MNFEVGRVYVGRVTRRFGNGDLRDDHKSIIVHTENHGKDKNDILSVKIKRFFSENEPFTVLEQAPNGSECTVCKILINNKICFLYHYNEPQTEFELIC